MQNLVILDDKGFLKNAKKKAMSKNKIIIRKFRTLDKRVLRLIFKVGLPEKIRTAFFPVLFGMMNFVLVKKIIK